MLSFEIWLNMKKNIGYTSMDSLAAFLRLPEEKQEKLRAQYENYVRNAPKEPPPAKVKCSECGKEYLVPRKVNFIFFCPECKKYNGLECEYGYAAITPCNIFLGDKEIGIITGGGREDYRLSSEEFGIDMKLTKGYKHLEVYHEAVDIIKEYL